jgi:hypothetical protein
MQKFLPDESSKSWNSLYKKEKPYDFKPQTRILDANSTAAAAATYLQTTVRTSKSVALHAKWQEASTGQGKEPGLCICHPAVCLDTWQSSCRKASANSLPIRQCHIMETGPRWSRSVMPVYLRTFAPLSPGVSTGKCHMGEFWWEPCPLPKHPRANNTLIETMVMNLHYTNNNVIINIWITFFV